MSICTSTCFVQIFVGTSGYAGYNGFFIGMTWLNRKKEWRKGEWVLEFIWMIFPSLVLCFSHISDYYREICSCIIHACMYDLTCFILHVFIPKIIVCIPQSIFVFVHIDRLIMSINEWLNKEYVCTDTHTPHLYICSCVYMYLYLCIYL